jgi:glutathione S-transferase
VLDWALSTTISPISVVILRLLPAVISEPTTTLNNTARKVTEEKIAKGIDTIKNHLTEDCQFLMGPDYTEADAYAFATNL